MQTNELSKEQILVANFLKKVPGRNQNIPSIGYYLFKEIIDIDFNEDGYLLKYHVRAYYHPNKPDFSAQCLISTQIASFFKPYSSGPTENGYDLTNQVVHLKEISLVDVIYKGEPFKAYKTLWDIIDSKNVDEIEFSQTLINDDLNTGIDESIDEELEMIFWEANQPEYHINQMEMEYLLNLWEIQNTEFAD